MARIQIIESPEIVPGSRIAVVAARYNSDIVERLLSGCLSTLSDKGVDDKDISVIKVPGAFELPLAARRMAERADIDAVIALGAVIRGETAHFDYVCGECAHGLARASLDSDKPVIFGVLTVDNERQAHQRTGDGQDNKGVEAANAALEMISVLRRISS